MPQQTGGRKLVGRNLAAGLGPLEWVDSGPDEAYHPQPAGDVVENFRGCDGRSTPGQRVVAPGPVCVSVQPACHRRVAGTGSRPRRPNETPAATTHRPAAPNQAKRVLPVVPGMMPAAED